MLENKQSKRLSTQKAGSAGHVIVHTSLLLLIIIVFSGCLKHKQVELPLQEEIDSLEKRDESVSLPDQWWTAFNDAELNRHMEKALRQNYSLAAAWERLNAAKAVARKASSNLYPSLSGAGTASREIDGGENIDALTLGLTASYEIDLWRRIRAQTAADDLRAQASEEAYRTAALTLSADIALTWVRLIEANKQSALLQRQIDTNENTLRILVARFESGQIRREDILRQQLSNEAIREEKISIETEIQTLGHQFALLLGELPQNSSYQVSKRLPSLTIVPVNGLSSDLVRRRPDIRRAYLELEAADKDLAVAVRDLYPKITLSASYISEAATAGNFFSSWITGIAGGVVAPLIDGGQRRAEVSIREEMRSESISLYAEAVLQAYGEVEDALIKERKQGERVKNLEGRLGLSRSAYEQVQLGYFNGANDFLSVLVSQYQLQAIERDLLQARRNLIEYRISLYRALAGGFKTPRETIPVKEG